MFLIEIESAEQVKWGEITWRNQNQLIMEISYSQTETKMPLIPEIESMEKIIIGYINKFNLGYTND